MQTQILIGSAVFTAFVLASGSAGASTKRDPKRLLDVPGLDPDDYPRTVPGVDFATSMQNLHFPLGKTSNKVSYHRIRGTFSGTPLARFGVRRGQAARLHCGIDFGAKNRQTVYAMGDGVVVGVQAWSGADAKAMMIQYDDGPAVLYGAISPESTSGSKRMVRVGDRVKAKQPVATIGRYPGNSSMLHLEMYTPGRKTNERWEHGKAPPKQLLNPTILMLQAKVLTCGAV